MKQKQISRAALVKLVRKWKQSAKFYGDSVKSEWEHGDKYASRRYEGESIAFRWCHEDLEKLL